MLSGSPHGSMMSCQSIAQRAFSDDKEPHCSTALQRSVRFSSESRSSNDVDCKRETSGSVSLTALTPTPVTSNCAMSQSVPLTSATFDLDETAAPAPASCRFPKLEECAHFHYERVSLGGVRVELASQTPPADGWISLRVRTHVSAGASARAGAGRAAGAPGGAGRAGGRRDAADVREWTLARSNDNLRDLDAMLHRCIYDRKVSGLPDLSIELTDEVVADSCRYMSLVSHYVHHWSMVADDSLNCGPVLNWLQMDNRGHKLLVANEDSSSINTPAVAAAYSVRKYVSQARDEISFEVGDMISIIDMPGPQESLWWRGKRGFRVGFFPHHCVAVIGDKVPRNMTQPPPVVGKTSNAPSKEWRTETPPLLWNLDTGSVVTPIKPVLRKHGKLISLFRSFILSRPSRRRLKQQGILRERVFGCDLGEHLLNSHSEVPLVLTVCASRIERGGIVDGVYRLSGGAGLTQRLRAAFDAGAAPDLAAPAVARDPHAVPSLLKMYFRELPNPLCTYQLYESFVRAVQQPDDAGKLRAVRDAVVKLPPPHYRTMSYLMRHLRRVSLLSERTGMTARNVAIVWAPNLLRAPAPHHALHGLAQQAVVTEFLICYAEELFAQEQGADSQPESLESDQTESQVELRNHEASSRRPKSLPLHPPTKLLSLEEARRRGGWAGAPRLPASGAIAAALRPAAHLAPMYIEVGSGPNNLPQYHTVLDLPLSGNKRGVKRSPSGWRGLFSRHKPQRPRRPAPAPAPAQTTPPSGIRPVKSCESLTLSDCDTLAPLGDRPAAALKHHTRSSSCDSYFEPWVAELATMRLRLSPQESDLHMFSEESDTHQGESGWSTPVDVYSAEPSPRKLTVDLHAASELAQRRQTALEEQLSQLRYIDGESPRARPAPEKRHFAPPADAPKRVCKDRDSPMSPAQEFQSAITNVKLRERNSPRKAKSACRFSGIPTTDDRLSWHGKDGHSTLIKIDWPTDSSGNLATINSSPLTPITPIYDPLESDSEASEANKHTITIKAVCESCDEEKCLKCELKAAGEVKDVSSSDVSYQNLNRLSAVSNSSASEPSDKKIGDSLKIMTSSHESTSSYSNASHRDDGYENFNFNRPNYINLQSSSTSKSSPSSPVKTPLKSTISITFRSPTKVKDYELIDDTPTNDRDSVYEDIDLEKNLSIVEEATVPDVDASIPTEEACQPQDLIILETPTDNVDVYSQVKFFKKSIDEVNAMILESPEKERHYENVDFESREYENVDIDALKICDKDLEISEPDSDDKKSDNESENGNVVKTKNLNVRELAIRFESPTEQKPPFTFEKFKAEIKYPSLERKQISEEKDEIPPSPKTHKLSRNSSNARSLDENAFVKEFGDQSYLDKRKSLDVKDVKPNKYLPDLNLNTESNEKITTPTTENKISLIQRFDDKKPDIKNIIGFESEKKLSRERIEKYKEERRNFLREKYSSQSFRSSPEQLTRIKIKKEDEKEPCERLTDLPKFERRNTVDLGQRMRFSLARSENNLESIPSPNSPVKESSRTEGEGYERKEKASPSFHIRDIAAIFEQKSQGGASQG